jgi:hypothetical protein
MEDEIKFTCEMCKKTFDPIPDSIIECGIDIHAINEETGEIEEIDDETRKQMLDDVAEEDPEIKPFLKGVVCMCLECQDKWAEDADETIIHPQ